MSALKDLTRKHIGKLIVLKRVPNKNGRVRWKCLCKCGREKIVWANNLLQKASTSCNHCIRQKHNNHLWTGYGELGGKQFWEIQDGAIRRNILFRVTIQYLWSLYVKQQKKCALSGIEIILGHEKDGTAVCTASLDRIDNNLGYVKGNVQWVHKDVNFMKQDLSQEEFLNYCRAICKHKCRHW